MTKPECKSDETYFSRFNKCKKGPFNSNKKIAYNFVGDEPTNDLFEECPQDFPFWDGVTCQTCKYPDYFNYTKGEC